MTERENLSPREQEALAVITDHLLKEKKAPTQQEIGDELGVSQNYARILVNSLHRKGAIDKRYGQTRGIRLWQ